MSGDAAFRMKEWWFYAKCAFANPLSVHRVVRKVRKAGEYEATVRQNFRTEPLAPVAKFTPPL